MEQGYYNLGSRGVGGGAGLRVKRLAVQNHVQGFRDWTAEIRFKVNELGWLSIAKVERLDVAWLPNQCSGSRNWQTRARVFEIRFVPRTMFSS